MKNKTATPKKPSRMQLNKFIAHAGICSRRKAVQLVKDGFVTVNHATVTDPAYLIAEKDEVRIRGKKIKQESYVYVLLNKPIGVITSVSDEEGRPTVMNFIQSVKKRLYPVGRLDRDTTGLLLLTNDGLLTQKLAHPRYDVKKVYRAVLDRSLTRDNLHKIRKGIRLKDGRVSVDRISCVPATSCRVVEIALHAGKYRIIRRLFEHIGYTVTSLDRTKYALLTKRGLRPGQWRYLTQKEIDELKRMK